MACRYGDRTEVRAVNAAVVDSRLRLRHAVHDEHGVFYGNGLALERDGTLERRMSVLGAGEDYESPGCETAKSRSGLVQQDGGAPRTAGSMLSELTVMGSSTHSRVASKPAASTAAVVVFFPEKPCRETPAGLSGRATGRGLGVPLGKRRRHGVVRDPSHFASVPTLNWCIMSWSSCGRLWQCTMYLPAVRTELHQQPHLLALTDVHHVLGAQLPGERRLAVPAEDLEVDQVDVHRVEPATGLVLDLPDLGVARGSGWPAPS